MASASKWALRESTNLNPSGGCSPGQQLRRLQDLTELGPPQAWVEQAAPPLSLWVPGRPTMTEATLGEGSLGHLQEGRGSGSRVAVRWPWGNGRSSGVFWNVLKRQSYTIPASFLLFLINSMSLSGSQRLLWKEALENGWLASFIAEWLIEQCCFVFWRGILWLF